MRLIHLATFHFYLDIYHIFITYTLSECIRMLSIQMSNESDTEYLPYLQPYMDLRNSGIKDKDIPNKLDNVIFRFKEEYHFLSNFHSSVIMCSYASFLQELSPQYRHSLGMSAFDNDQTYLYPTVEHFFQANKAVSIRDHMLIQRAYTPGHAKQLGRRTVIEPMWDQIRCEIMFMGVWLKFKTHASLKQKLLDTKEDILIEGNWWNDTTWGVSLKTGIGYNWLGQTLMLVRDKLKDDNHV